ncbi:MAG: phosphoribosylglycinamide formyltransferase [Actinomycetota bacterium]|nr:phosphoribosylglycinamide formyltransferase [Actinomycetota bacterium]
MTSRLVVLATGSGSNLQAILDACADGTLAAEVVLVVVNRRTAYAADRAAAAGVPSVYRPMGPFREAVPDDPRRARERYDAALAAEIADVRPDLIVQAGWMHLFTSAFLDRFPGMVVNLHPALPGAFPGANAIDDAWAAHETDGLDHTGIMVHLVPDEGVDDGPVLASQRVPITADDTRETLEARLHEVEHELFVATIADYLRTR